jgi:predicted ATPase/serine phosphatase RsbU (regulator of sigma subunit)
MSTRYVLGVKIRDVGPAELFRARRVADAMPVVVKLAGDHATPAQLARLRHEQTIFELVQGKGIARSLGLERVRDALALVIEDPGDRSLDALVGIGRHDVARFLDLAVAMTEIVEIVHRKQVIHKDIKPHHFFVSAGDRLALVDFGVATRLAHEDRRAFGVDRLEGTLAYMSPEQTGRMNRVLDRRTDLYSLGVALYELATGVLPFRTDDPLELVHSHIARTPTPPYAVAPEIPRIVSDIIMRLLSKVAEDRYQDAAGLRFDLQRARVDPTPFALGEQDFSDELRISQKLYGREAETAALVAAFDRVRAGAGELVLVWGDAGVGKSALVNELRGAGHFVSGRFDPVGRAVPYAAIAAACGELVRSILTGSAQVLASWRQRLLAAVGVNGRIVAGLVPEIELVIGPQPPVAELEPSESQNRFEAVFHAFLGAFMPLAMFLDDLQWADVASLRLIRTLLVNRPVGHVLVVGAYRDNEVDAAHPLALALAELRKDGAAVGAIELRPLGADDVRRWLADSLGGDRDAIGELAAIAVRKTHGNPFFLSQFLTTLAKDGVLVFDTDARRWTWNVARVEDTLVTDNVVDVMIGRLRRLAPPTQRALSLAACIGHTFDTEMLSAIAETADVATLLWEPLRDGLVRGSDEASYAFSHDRVREAAYALLAETDKQATHLRIGRLITARSGDHAFDIVNHMNRGAALIASREERLALARMNLSAARRARAAAAYATALELVSVCVALLGGDRWGDTHNIAFAAQLVIAECEFLTARFDDAFASVAVAEQRARTVVERAAALDLRMLILLNLNRMHEAAAVGVDGARLLGSDMPPLGSELGPAIGAEIAAIQAALAGRTPEELIDLPTMTDPEKRALVAMHHRLNPAAIQTDGKLMVLNILKAVNLSLRHGIAPVSCYFFTSYGLLMAAQGQLDLAYRFGRLGIRLDLAGDNRSIDAPTHMVFAAFCAFWRRPITESLDYHRRALGMSVENGNHIYVGYCSTFLSLYRFFAGDNLDDIRAEGRKFAERLARLGDKVNPNILEIIERAAAALNGETAGRGTLDGDGFDSEAAAARVLATGNPHMISTTFTVRAIVSYLAGDLAAAWSRLATLQSVPGNYVGPQIAVYRALVLASRIVTGEAADPVADLSQLRAHGDQLRAFAESSPATFGHLAELVAAEISAIAGDHDAALGHYDKAIALAIENESQLFEALANELCGKFLLRWRGPKLARTYLAEAHDAYRRWGAPAKAQELAGYVVAARRPVGEVRAEQIDMLAVVRASQALSTEIVLARLIDSLMSVVIEQAGAQKGCLLLVRDGRLWVEGMAGTAAEPTGFARFALDAGDAVLPRSVIGYVQRTHDKVLLGHAERTSLFSADPYLDRAGAPRSLLCLPLLRQRELIGILYLENSLTGDAFSPDRVGLLDVLAAQAAISVENATLYDELERRVADRTRELEASVRTIQENQAQLVEAERKAAVAHYEREMTIARQIQTSILPRTPRIRGFDVAASMVTASEVGGDYYDVVPVDDGGFWLGIGDVSGHGLNAGLMMMMLQSGLAALMRDGTGEDPARLVCQVNRMLYENMRVRLGSADFATLALFRFHPDGRFAIAGAHEETLVWRARTRRLERLPIEGVWVGIAQAIEPKIRSREHRLDEGDFIVAYTDGIIEAKIGPEQFGIERLERQIEQLHGESAETICRSVFRTITEIAPELTDDRTLLVIRRATA